MSVVSVNEIHEGRGGSDDGRVRRHTRVWRVITDDPADDDVTAMAAVGVSRGDTHPSDAGAWAISADAKHGDSRLIWLVTIEYSSEREITENPLNEPARISWDGEPFQRPLIRDKDGKAVLNSAGDPFDPPIMRDDNRPVVRVTKNVASVPVWVLNYRDVVNSDAFTVDGVSIGVGMAKIKWIPVSEWQEQNFIRYRILTIEIHLNKDGWNFKPLDQGYREKIPGFQFLRRAIPDDLGKQVTQPALLDGEGHKLQDPTTENAHFLDFEGYEELPFSILPLS